MVSSDPTDVSVAFKLGLVYLDLGDHSRAEEVFLRVVAIEPSHMYAKAIMHGRKILANATTRRSSDNNCLRAHVLIKHLEEF